MELHGTDMSGTEKAQFGIADNSMAMALSRDAAQRKCNELRRFAKALRGGASQRLRDAMSGIDKQRKCIAKRSEGIA